MKLGIEVFLEKYTEKFKGKRIGLLTNLTGVNHQLESSIDLMYAHKNINLTALFGPEHGLRGEVSEGEWVDSSVDAATGIPIYSLYNQEKKPNKAMLNNVDVIFCDLQDIGVRYYTFIYSMANMMKICGEQGKKVVILDRPNPINGNDLEGNLVESAFQSFVGQFPIPVRHGLTIGELAILFKHEFNIECDVEVIKMEEWSRDTYFDQTDLYWVSPTPNTTTIDMCLLYPGTCLIEGTNISEGRGTTKPFEFIGAPFINGKELAEELKTYQLDGVLFRPTVFRPMYQKHAGKVCEGVQLHILDRSKMNAFEIGIHLLDAVYKLYPNKIEFIRNKEFDNHYFLDLLAGTNQLRESITKGNTAAFFKQIPEDISKFKQLRKSYLLY
ncbi:DUF1343 domain-containing protein [Ralstonia pickettii]|nr:DUF1343 domain-containing protein [Ralstonia pickettii]